jgi:hypothetical protein
MRHAKAGQFTSYSSTDSQLAEEPAERPSTAIWPCQLHYHGGDAYMREGSCGTFFLNEHPIIILFDSRSSHDFISFTCVERARLTLVASRSPYMISTPGSRVDTDRIAQKVALELSRRVISTNLIVLSGHGIDIILGMKWMKLHKVILDIAARLVHLYSPVHGKVTLHLPVIARIRDCLHHVVERMIENIQVVHEFPDVFLDDLSGMPPERAIEFKIELNPVRLLSPKLHT